jgi:hypothetical protein
MPCSVSRCRCRHGLDCERLAPRSSVALLPDKLNINKQARPGEVYVQTVDSLIDGALYEPTLTSGHQSVRINTGYPYYHKVYVPNLSRNVTIQGMDALLWALGAAELSSTSPNTQRHFEEMRFELSRILRKLVEDLPEPEIDEDVAG